jgi:hypothetical protein
MDDVWASLVEEHIYPGTVLSRPDDARRKRRLLRGWEARNLVAGALVEEHFIPCVAKELHLQLDRAVFAAGLRGAVAVVDESDSQAGFRPSHVWCRLRNRSRHASATNSLFVRR